MKKLIEVKKREKDGENENWKVQRLFPRGDCTVLRLLVIGHYCVILIISATAILTEKREVDKINQLAFGGMLSHPGETIACKQSDISIGCTIGCNFPLMGGWDMGITKASIVCAPPHFPLKLGIPVDGVSMSTRRQGHRFDSKTFELRPLDCILYPE